MWEQTVSAGEMLGEEVGQRQGRTACWAASLGAHPVRAREINGEEREKHSPRHAVQTWMGEEQETYFKTKEQMKS